MNTRLGIFLGAIVLSVLWIAILDFLIPSPVDDSEHFAAELLLSRGSESLSHPFSIQNLMWIVFFIGAGELLVRLNSGNNEVKQLHRGLLPEDEKSVLYRAKKRGSGDYRDDPQDVGTILRGVKKSDPDRIFWLQNILSRSILAFQTSGGSIEQVSTVYESTLELLHHELDLRYNLIRYLVWLIPTLGFIGTVVGIALALRSAGVQFEEFSSADLATFAPKLMKSLTGDLGVAFYTTLLALLQSAVLMCAMHVIQGREESTINKIGQYCMDHFITRLYEKH